MGYVSHVIYLFILKDEIQDYNSGAIEGNLMDHLVSVLRVRGLFQKIEGTLNITWVLDVWVIWKERNRHIFYHKKEHLQS